MTLDDFNRIMSEYDSPANKGFDVFELARALRSAYPHDKPVVDNCIEYEITAFQFVEKYSKENNPWGDYYYGPTYANLDSKGIWHTAPDLESLTEEMVNYWLQRLSDAKNPLLAAWYGGLVYEFYKKVFRKPAPYKIVEKHLDTIINLTKGNYDISQLHTFYKLERALSIAISFNKPGHIIQIKDVLIEYENKHGEDQKAGTFGYSIELLVDNAKVALAKDEENDIVSRLTGRLKRQSELGTRDEDFNPSSVERAARLLAAYHSKRKQEDDLQRVFNLYQAAIDKIVALDSPMISNSYLAQQIDFCTCYGPKEEKDALLARMQEIGKAIPGGLKEISVPLSIPKEKLDRLCEDLLSGDTDNIFAKITYYFIPKYRVEEQQVLELSKVSISSLISISILDDNGRTVATIGSVKDDLEGRTFYHLAETLRISSVFLDFVFERAVNEGIINIENVLAFLRNSFTIKENQFTLIELALKHFFAGEYAAFIHIAIPQIEVALRNVIELSGHTTYCPNDENGYDVYTLGKILSHPAVAAIDEDMICYFNVILSNRKGWNLRNNVSHGLLSEKDFNKLTANMVLHALLCLGIIRNSATNDDEKGIG